jgi:hypothetical protein
MSTEKMYRVHSMHGNQTIAMTATKYREYLNACIALEDGDEMYDEDYGEEVPVWDFNAENTLPEDAQAALDALNAEEKRT